MKTKDVINAQLVSYEKLYEKTKNFEELKANIYNAILDIERITPVSPFYSSYLFHTKLDCENLDRYSAKNILLSLQTFLERLES